jgi:Type ISP C-terminal specificity domain/N-6 DNA Methylase
MRRPVICAVAALGNQPDYVYTLRMSMLNDFLSQTRRIHISGLATDERSYYPALAALFDAVGATLSPRVVAIHDVASRGAGHPDYVLQADTTHDTRAAIEAKPASYALDDIIASEQVRQYTNHYGLCLVTNLREFALVSPGRAGRAGNVAEIMRYSLATSEAEFWNASPLALNRRHEQGIADFLVTVFTWDAEITRPKDLAEALARYAREALRRLEHQPTDQLAALRLALKEALGLHFTDEQGEHFFRSSLVQTLFYGLFSAWVVFRRNDGRNDAGGDAFSWRAAGDYLRLPVMRELFERIAIGNQLEMLDIRKPLEWAEATLRRTQWEPFAASFAHGDAVQYFYEPFLEAYDPTLREQLGVWYTPREIITYQVARVDRLLREELRLPLGLADSRVVVLDPATGTGGYLLEVLRVIDQTLRASGAEAMRALHLREAATQRVFGFEILPAPFVVAHLQIATLLAEHEASLGARQRAGVYLTNSLTGWNVEEAKQLVLPEYPALKHEAESAAEVKQRAKILVVLGNPPYRAQAGVAEDEERDLIVPYYVGLKERFDVQARGINDLYVRFFRLAERQIAETTGRGIVSLISNNAWLDSLSLPVMRERMLTAFDRIWIDNLNGGGMFHGSRGPDGKPDRSAFEYVGGQGSVGITVATSITTMLKLGAPVREGHVVYRNLWGQGHEKRMTLAREAQLPSNALDGNYQPLRPVESSRFIFKPGSIDRAYETWPAIDELFIHQYPGVKTSRDADLIAIDRDALANRMKHYFDPRLSDAEVAEYAPVLMQDASRYDAKATRAELLRTSRFQDDRLMRSAYRPLDDRWMYWEPTTKLLDEKRTDLMQQVFPSNLYLVACTKARRGLNVPTITDKLSDSHLLDPFALLFPLYVKPEQQTLFGEDGPQLNLRQEALDTLIQAVGAAGDPAEHAAIAIALFYHILAATYSPQYATENEGSLLQDWPRIPIPATRELLEASAALGRTVGDLLCPDVAFAPSDDVRALGVPTRSDGGQFSEDDLRVTVRYGGIGRYEPPLTEGQAARPGRIWWNDVGYWNNVPPEVWAFTIGGYPVIKKWLDYRHIERLKRPLRSEEVRYVGEMAQRIATLLALGPALDASYRAVKANTLTLA